MKKSIFYLIFLFAGCNTTTTNQNPEGMYVCWFENEFSKIADTLLLQKISGNYFKIIRHSGVANNKRKFLLKYGNLNLIKIKMYLLK